MSLSNELISQFAKITNDSPSTKKKESTVYGTIVTQDGTDYLHIDGAYDQNGDRILQPLLTTVATASGNRVIVSIRNHMAVVTGNLTTPSVTVEKTVTVVETTVTDKLKAAQGEIDELKAHDIETDKLVADKIDAKVVEANYAKLDEAKVKYAEIDTIKGDFATFKETTTKSLDANSADIDTLDAGIADIKTLIFGSATGDTIQTKFANAVIAQLGEAQIKSAMIEAISASKIKSGDILTNKVRVMSEDGGLIISDKLIQISEGDDVRVQIGKDANGKYSIIICDANGEQMFTSSGITDKAIKEAIINNDMVSETANISASKLDIDSLFTEINKDGTNTIKSSKVYLDDKKQTLDVSFKELSDEVTSQGSTFSVTKEKVDSKVWKQDINAVQIGGRNLLPDTDFGGVSKRYERTEGRGSEGGFYFTPTIQIESGVEYILSARIRGNANINLYQLCTGGNVGKQWILRDKLSTTDYRLYSVTFVPSTDRTLNQIYICTAYGEANTLVGDWFEIEPKSLKLERGNKATDWTPAPEDVDAAISTLGDNLEASMTTKYSQLEQDIDSITTTVAEHTADFENSILAINSKFEHDQLIVNGGGEMGNNTNFSSWIFDGTQTNNSAGSFTITDKSYKVLYSDEDFLVNPNREYTLSVDLKSQNGLSTLYAYLLFKDIDKNEIVADHTIFVAGTTTTLAQDLKAGDTVVYLTDMTNWDPSKNSKGCNLIVWNYKNSYGGTYPAETYSRNAYRLVCNVVNYQYIVNPDYFDYDAKTVTLNAAYSGPTIPAGTQVSQGGTGATYKYLLTNVTIPATWTSYSQKVTGLDLSGGGVSRKFPPGTAYASVGFLWNYNKADDQIWMTNVSVRDTTEQSATNTRITNAETRITQTSNSVTILANRTTAVENDLEDNYYDKTETEALIKVESDAITATVSSNTEEITETQTTAGDLESRIAAAESIIKQLSESISTLVTDGDGTSLMTQTTDGWTFSTVEIQNAINDAQYRLNKLNETTSDTQTVVDILQSAVDELGELSEYVKIGTYEDEPCIILGESDSDFKLRITNTRILFMDGSDIPAYISNKALNIKKAVIEEELHQGEWVWKARSNGNLGLQWRGGSV